MLYILKNKFGGILLDLIVAMGIVALLSTITIPYLSKYQPNLKLDATARDLTTDIRYAQQLTITEQTTYKVKFFVDNNNYQILKIDTATTTVKSVALDHDISIKQITGLVNNEIVFNDYGGVVNSGQVILTNINNATATINIKPSGYIELLQ